MAQDWWKGVLAYKDMRGWIIFYLYLLLCKNWLRNHYGQQFYNKYRNWTSQMLNFMRCCGSSTQLRWPLLKPLLRNYSPWSSIFVTKSNNWQLTLISCIRCSIVKLHCWFEKSMKIMAVLIILSNNSEPVEPGSGNSRRKPGILRINTVLPSRKINT